MNMYVLRNKLNMKFDLFAGQKWKIGAKFMSFHEPHIISTTSFEISSNLD